MSLPYSMQSIPGKGIGLVATRSISRGELLLAEAPLFNQGRSHSNDTILKSLSGLTDSQQREFFSLHNAWKGILPPPLGIFKTNALPCGDNDTTSFSASGAIFMTGSRFNTSCVPNVNNYWNDDIGQITFRAARDIVTGEELQISYNDTFASRDARRERLKRLFRFDCQCTACSQEGDQLRASDLRRVTLAQLYDEIAQYGNAPPTGVRKVKEALGLLAEEGLFTRRASFYYDALKFCVSVSDSQNAKAWAKKAWEEYCVERGADSDDAKKMHGYTKNPRAHMAFGLLPRKTLSGPPA
ncbi:SET domain-containing protein [Trametes meyenii]|nr:SET domain-containing protein [Trametes meyenii]